jgi:hypothetical protein
MENFMGTDLIDKDDLYTRNQSIYDMPLGHGRKLGNTNFQEDTGKSQTRFNLRIKKKFK